MKTWLKGGLIGGMVGIIIWFFLSFSYLFGVYLNYNDYTLDLTITIYRIFFNNLDLGGLANFIAALIGFLLWFFPIVLGFVIGTLIGFWMGKSKIKEKRK